MNNPTTITISLRDTMDWRSIHHVLSCKLADAGFDIGPMLWTAAPDAYTNKEIAEKWNEALDRAGVTKWERTEDLATMDTIYRFWRRSEDNA